MEDGAAVELPEVATSIVEVAAALGAQIDQVPNPGDELLQILADYVEELDSVALAQFHRFEERCMAENEDRIQIQLRGIERFESRSLESLERTLLQYQLTKSNLIAATEGRINKLRKKCEILRTRIESKCVISADCATIAAGFVQVH